MKFFLQRFISLIFLGARMMQR